MAARNPPKDYTTGSEEWERRAENEGPGGDIECGVPAFGGPPLGRDARSSRRLRAFRRGGAEAAGADPAGPRDGLAAGGGLRSLVGLSRPPGRAHRLRLGAHRGHLDHALPRLLAPPGRTRLD